MLLILGAISPLKFLIYVWLVEVLVGPLWCVLCDQPFSLRTMCCLFR